MSTPTTTMLDAEFQKHLDVLRQELTPQQLRSVGFVLVGASLNGVLRRVSGGADLRSEKYVPGLVEHGFLEVLPKHGRTGRTYGGKAIRRLHVTQEGFCALDALQQFEAKYGRKAEAA